MLDLTPNQRKFLRGLAHKLEPAVQLGKSGLTEAVVKEAKRQLLDRELIKIKIEAEDRDQRKELIETLATETESAFVQSIGKIAVLYRKHPKKPVIKLPKT